MLQQSGDAPWDHTKLQALSGTSADILLNGHDHARQWSDTVKSKRDKCLVVCPGSVGRTAIDDEHTPSVVLIGINEDEMTWKHKLVELKSAKPHNEVFEKAVEKHSRSSDDEIEAFVTALKEEGEDMQGEDIRSAVKRASKGKSKEVVDSVMGRLGF